ncbi:MAG TPA: VasL domain-containing protein [Scandinavium sp.]|jgi:type VI secretion system protein VasL
MNQTEPRHIRTGGDPRSLPDFTTLRDEMLKLVHPARPDVDWKKVETLSLSLFEQNGAELQTAAWYTLARSHLARMSGMNEGLTLLSAMLTHQWAQCWPAQTLARAEILSGLSQRLQKVCRTFTLTHDDLPALLEAETQLQRLNAILERHDLKPACQIMLLEQQVRSALTRLENSARPDALSVAPIPQVFVTLTPEIAAPPAQPLVYVIPSPPEASVQVRHDTPSVPKRWPAFVAGIVLTCLTGGSALGIHHWQHRTDSVARDLSRTLAPLPEVLTAEQRDAVRQTPVTQEDTRLWVTRTSTQLKVLSALQPDWNLQYGNQLLMQAEALWPGNKHVMLLRQRWQQQLMMSAVPEMRLTGWQQGMAQLQALADKLNALDGQKGKYMTVSELKSAVFGAINDFHSAVPVEEQLRALTDPSQSAAQKLARQKDAQQHLQQLLARYSLSTTLQETRTP